MTSFNISGIPLDEGGSKRKDKCSKLVDHSSLETLGVQFGWWWNQVGELGEWPKLLENVKTLEGRIEHALDGVKAQMAEVEETHERERQLEVLLTKITVLEKAMANTGSRPKDVPKLKIPKPKHFMVQGMLSLWKTLFGRWSNILRLPRWKMSTKA